jgi:hypothetical protein
MGSIPERLGVTAETQSAQRFFELLCVFRALCGNFCLAYNVAVPRRLLSASELAEARLVFGAGLDYTRAFVSEKTRWPNWVADVGAAMHRSQRTWHNAISLGDTCYFPVTLHTSAKHLAQNELSDMAWLIHELTHQWQFQRMGWRYLTEALRVQVREGMNCYDYSGQHPTKEEALLAAHVSGRRLADFNPEQQADIARD